jgi:Ca2+-binding RTX toxin-like protein
VARRTNPRAAAALLGWLLTAAFTSSDVGASGNAVPASKVTRVVLAITANTLKPSTCSAITLTTVVSGIAGTTGNDLLLGTAGAETMTAVAGSDCVLGGGGNDVIDGGPGTDVCIGGPGTDTFTNCETQVQ